MEVNWTTLSLFIIGFFVLIGFFRGWWKEAITTAFLTVLVFLLAYPSMAESLINGINKVVALVWGWVPDSLQQSMIDLFSIKIVPPQLDANSSTTWMVILIVMLAISIIIGRFSLSGSGYQVRPLGSIFGGLLGGLNGFILMGLVTAYLQGTTLPGGGPPATEISAQSGTAVASSGVSIQAFNLPNFTLDQSFLPYLIMIIGLAVFIMAMRNRVNLVSKDGYRSVKAKPPYGYKAYGSGKGGNGKG